MNRIKKLTGYATPLGIALFSILALVVLTVCAAWLKDGLVGMLAEVGRLMLGIAKG